MAIFQIGDGKNLKWTQDNGFGINSDWGANNGKIDYETILVLKKN